MGMRVLVKKGFNKFVLGRLLFNFGKELFMVWKGYWGKLKMYRFCRKNKFELLKINF